MSKKAREFWIERKSFSSDILVAYEEKPDEITYKIAKDVFHTIEYSQYDQLKKAAMKLRDMVILYAESGRIEAFHAESNSLSDTIDAFDEAIKE